MMRPSPPLREGRGTHRRTVRPGSGSHAAPGRDGRRRAGERLRDRHPLACRVPGHRERGVVEVYAAATHGILSGPAISRLCGSPLREVVLADTVPLAEHKQLDVITTLTISPLLGQAISRIHTGQSVGALFH